MCLVLSAESGDATTVYAGKLDDGWFGGRLREVPGVFSQGKRLEELEANIEDAYELMRQGEGRAEPGPGSNDELDTKL